MKFHFFGKDCIINRGLSERSNLNEALVRQKFSFDHVLFVNQIHGKEVVVIDEKSKIYGEQNLPKADAIITNLKNVVIGVITADCAPVLLFDKKAEVIAAAHAGWRGAKLGILQETVAAMKNLGAENIEAFIGPMIQQESYEISQEFFDDFVDDNSENEKFFIEGEELGKFLFNLPSYVEEILVKSGVKTLNSKIDTYKNEENFFSFRRSTHLGEKDCGRNVSVISLN
jgi:polyphenol oxidase